MLSGQQLTKYFLSKVLAIPKLLAFGGEETDYRILCIVEIGNNCCDVDSLPSVATFLRVFSSYGIDCFFDMAV